MFSFPFPFFDLVHYIIFHLFLHTFLFRLLDADANICASLSIFYLINQLILTLRFWRLTILFILYQLTTLQFIW